MFPNTSPYCLTKYYFLIFRRFFSSSDAATAMPAIPIAAAKPATFAESPVFTESARSFAEFFTTDVGIISL